MTDSIFTFSCIFSSVFFVNKIGENFVSVDHGIIYGKDMYPFRATLLHKKII